ncbi:hypothetical protein BDV93DRAFT_280768 [Ceratobasidium sp. AG-I]|nr:hypothetical protein BDV93DRAFT_280768 [Ceratobasidium sp. AG-I]
MAHNPGHTQSAVHPVSAPLTKAELTSAVMDGEGTRAGHGHEGAGDGSRGGVGPMMWEARALAVVSKGMSADPQPHHDAPSDGEKSTRTEAPASMPAPMNMPTPNPA